jgi:hypothetical protein
VAFPLSLEKCLNLHVSSRSAKTNFHSISSLLYVALKFHLSMNKYLPSQLKEKCKFPKKNHKKKSYINNEKHNLETKVISLTSNRLVPLYIAKSTRPIQKK